MTIMRKLQQEVDGPSGYSLELKLLQAELSEIRNIIELQWLEVIKKYIPNQIDLFKKNGLMHYHKLSNLLNHSTTWPTSERILPKYIIDQIREMSFFQRLAKEFDILFLSDDEGMGEEMVWRLVRPNEPKDVGPLHADAWFWELGHGRPSNESMKRVKVWIAIYCEPGKNGLKIVSGSHRRHWPYSCEKRHGYLKPCFDETIVDLPIELTLTQPGDAIVFNERLLHGGAINMGSETRVSLEFDLCVRPW